MRSLRCLSEAPWHGPLEEARAAAAELARHPDPRAVPPLLAALDRPYCTEAAAAAVVALGAEAVPGLVAALRRKVGYHAAGVLARLGPAAETAVVAGTSSPNGQVRASCFRLLPTAGQRHAGRCGSRRARPGGGRFRSGRALRRRVAPPPPAFVGS